METLLQDIRYALRMLVKSPGFTAIAIVTLALGIGANTAIFTVINRVLLNPLPGVDATGVYSVFTTDKKNTGGFLTFMQTAYLNAKDYRDMNDVFSHLVITAGNGATLDLGSGHTVPVGVELVDWDYFQALGTKIFMGRDFLPDEDAKPDAYPVAVMSYGFWKDQFGGDAGFVGKTITLNHQSYTVVGIAPKDFTGEFALGGPNLWVPIMMHDQIAPVQPHQPDWFNERRGLAMNMIGRLKPGVTFQQAQGSMQALGRRLETEYPNENTGRNVALLPLTEASINPNLRSVFIQAGILLQGAVGLVLLIACANVANLLLVRGSRRQREMAVRLSMGASRWRISRQLLTESLILSLLAGAGGILFAVWTQKLLKGLTPPFVGNVLQGIPLDAHMLLVTLVIAVGTGLLFGIAPARQASRADLMLSLRDRTDPTMNVNRLFGVRNLLVVAQVCLSIIALVGAGLFVRSLGNAEKIDPGFEINHLAVVGLNLGGAGYDQAHAKQFYIQLLDRVRALPMVESAGIGVNQQFSGGFMRTVFPEGVDPTDRRAGKLTPVDPVEPDYFKTMGIPILRGRAFDENDRDTTQMVAVINQTLANRLWPGQDPIGRHLKFFGETWNVEVVGVARDCKYGTLGEDPQGYVYFALDQQMSLGAQLYVHTKGDPTQAISPVREAVKAIDSNLILRNATTMPTVLDNALSTPKMGAELLGGFGLLALLLASLGIYGVMSYSVAQRTNEMGIRIALGAKPGDILRLVLGQGVAVVAMGVVAGLALAAAATLSLKSLLFGMSTLDPITYAAVAAILLGTALLACFFPAHRATRVDPMVALRYE